MVSEGRHHIRNGAQAHALNIGGVIAGAAGMVIRSGCNAVIDQQGQKRRRHKCGIETLDHIIAPDLDIDKIFHLPDKSAKEVIEFGELLGVAGFNSDFFTGPGVFPIMQGDLKYFWQIEVSGKDIAFLSESPDLNTSAGPAPAGVIQGFPLADQLLNNQIRIKYRRLTKAGSDDSGCPLDEPVRIFLADLNG